MKLKPLNDRLIVTQVDQDETTASGIVLPDTAQEKPMRGTVVAVSEGRWNESGDKRIPPSLSEGDEILYSSAAFANEITFDGEDFLVLREQDVIAKVA